MLADVLTKLQISIKNINNHLFIHRPLPDDNKKTEKLEMSPPEQSSSRVWPSCQPDSNCLAR